VINGRLDKHVQTQWASVSDEALARKHPAMLHLSSNGWPSIARRKI
jgi:hypothetical protein